MLSLFMDMGAGEFECTSDTILPVSVDCVRNGTDVMYRGYVTNKDQEYYYTDVRVSIQNIACSDSPFGMTPFGLAPFGRGNCTGINAVVPFKLHHGPEFPTEEEWSSLQYWGNTITLGNIGSSNMPSVNTRAWFYLLFRASYDWPPGETKSVRILCQGIANEI